MPNSEETRATVNVRFSHLVSDEAEVEIDLAEYRAWLGLQSDESFEFTESEVREFIESGMDPCYEVTRQYGLSDFQIEWVDFDCT
jgi:hypothetical protein